MVQEESKVECILLSVIVCYEVDRLEVVLEAAAKREHREEKLCLVASERIDDFILLLSVQHEVLVDDLAVDQGLDIELLLEDGLDKAVLLSAPEALELSLAGVAKSYALVLVLQLYLQFLALSLLVQDVVAEVDQNHQLVLWLLRVFECLPCELLISIIDIGFFFLLFGSNTLAFRHRRCPAAQGTYDTSKDGLLAI